MFDVLYSRKGVFCFLMLLAQCCTIPGFGFWIFWCFFFFELFSPFFFSLLLSFVFALFRFLLLNVT